MEKTERYTITKHELYQILSEHIKRPISKVKFSPRNQTLICEVVTTEE